MRREKLLRPKVSRLAISLGALVLLSACGATHYLNRLHPEYGQTDLDRDWYECRRENTQPAATVAGAYGSAKMVVDDGMAMQCFRARGWYQDSQPSRQPSSSTPPPRQGTSQPTKKDTTPACDFGMYRNSTTGQCVKLGE